MRSSCGWRSSSSRESSSGSASGSYQELGRSVSRRQDVLGMTLSPSGRLFRTAQQQPRLFGRVLAVQLIEEVFDNPGHPPTGIFVERSCRVGGVVNHLADDLSDQEEPIKGFLLIRALPLQGQGRTPQQIERAVRLAPARGIVGDAQQVLDRSGGDAAASDG